MKPLKFLKDENFEFLIILSLLSRKSIVINLKSDLQNYLTFLNFIKIISPRSTYVKADNSLAFSPKSLGGNFFFKDSSITYNLKFLILISPFLKESVEAEMNGITNDLESVDLLKITFSCIFKFFNLPKFEINIKKRGFSPLGEGLVIFKGRNVNEIKNIEASNPEKLLKIRGLVVTARIGSDYSHRMINEIKNNMSDLGDTKVQTIVNNRNDSGPSPGYEISLVAESKNGLFCSTLSSTSEQLLPEKMAKLCCFNLINEIKNGGIFDGKLMPYIIFYMGLSKGVGSIRVGLLSDESKSLLEILNLFFNVEYNLKEDQEEFILTIIGCNYSNIFKSL